MNAELNGDASVAPSLRDGYEVHAAALRRGLDVVLLPRQVMTARSGAGGDARPGSGGGNGEELSFVHGIPQTSSLAAVTFAQDKRMRRALLTTAGLAIPKGGVYSIRRGEEFAKRLIDRVGYPVVVKPAIGDNAVEVQAGLRNEAELHAAIDHLSTPPARRPGHTKAAYALTVFAEPEEHDGEITVPSGYRYLVEQHISGEYLRCVVLADTAVSVLSFPDGPWGRDGRRAVTAEAHPSLLRLAREAVRAVPGLALAAVDIVVEDHERDIAEQQACIVELSERPWLAAQPSAEDSAALGEAILAQHAAEFGHELAAPAERVAVELHCEGVTHPEQAVAAVAEAGVRSGVHGEIAVSDAVEGVAEGVLQGSPASIAGLTELLLAGELSGHRAMLVEERARGLGDWDGLRVRR